MKLAAHELIFTQRSTCKTYSTSIIPGCEPSKILPWPTGWETLE